MRSYIRQAINEKTRPDTRPIPVAGGWAGADMRVFTLSNSITTDERTDGRTDGQTKTLIESLVRDRATKKRGTNDTTS